MVVCSIGICIFFLMAFPPPLSFLVGDDIYVHFGDLGVIMIGCGGVSKGGGGSCKWLAWGKFCGSRVAACWRVSLRSIGKVLYLFLNYLGEIISFVTGLWI